MITKDDLKGLPTSEIKRLFHETRKLAIAQRDQDEQVNDLRPKTAGNSGIHFVEGSWCTCEGGLASHTGAEPSRYVVERSGAVRELKPGEEAPASPLSEHEKWLLQAPDYELERLSEKDYAAVMEHRKRTTEDICGEFVETCPRYHQCDDNQAVLTDYLSRKYLLVSCDEDEVGETLNELLKRGVLTVPNMIEAFRELSEQGLLRVRPGDTRKLDAEEIRTLSAACSTARTDADWENIADEYLRLTTGSPKGLRVLALDPRYNKAAEAAVYFIFTHSTLDFDPSDVVARQYIEKYCAGRFPSVRLLRAGYAAYLRAKEQRDIQQDEHAAQPKPTPEDEALQRANELAREIARASWSGI